MLVYLFLANKYCYFFRRFIWVMGMSYSISLNRRLQRAAPRRELIIQVLRRVLLLIILGLVLNSHVTEGVSLSNIRIPGVLQHIALTYLFIGIIESIFTRRTINEYQVSHFYRIIINDCILTYLRRYFSLDLAIQTLCFFSKTIVRYIIIMI